MHRLILSLALALTLTLTLTPLSTEALGAKVETQTLAFDVPVNEGFVTDTTQTITQAQDNDLEAMLAQYRKDTSNEIAVVIVASMSGTSIIDAGTEIGRKWGVGTKEDENGILMLIALQDREVAILTGYGLEGAVPDIVAKGIIDTEMVPRFRGGEYYEGVLAGVTALQKHIGGEYTANRYDEEDGSFLFGFVLFLFFVGFEYLAALFGRTKSWWLGGVVGAGFGLLFMLIQGWWLAIPLLAGIGLLFDYIVSRSPVHHRRGRGGGIWPGGGMGGRGGGGFGGFGGGSFGGGGARGRW